MSEEPEKSRDGAMQAPESDSRSGHGGSQQSHQDHRQEHRPFGNAVELYEIPKTRPDDPPMRSWWFEEDEERR